MNHQPMNPNNVVPLSWPRRQRGSSGSSEARRAVGDARVDQGVTLKEQHGEGTVGAKAWRKKHAGSAGSCYMLYAICCYMLYLICYMGKTCYMVFLISETMSIQVRHVPCRFHGKLWEAGASGGSLSPTQLCSGPQQKRQQSHGFLRYRNTHLSSGNVGITGITIIKPPIFLGMVNIPTIYGDDWGMVYCCRTHMNLR